MCNAFSEVPSFAECHHCKEYDIFIQQYVQLKALAITFLCNICILLISEKNFQNNNNSYNVKLKLFTRVEKDNTQVRMSIFQAHGKTFFFFFFLLN